MSAGEYPNVQVPARMKRQIEVIVAPLFVFANLVIGLDERFIAAVSSSVIRLMTPSASRSTIRMRMAGAPAAVAGIADKGTKAGLTTSRILGLILVPSVSGQFLAAVYDRRTLRDREGWWRT